MIYAMLLITKKTQPLKSNPCLTYYCSHSIHKPEASQYIRMILPRGSDCEERALDHIPTDLVSCLQFKTNSQEEEKRKNYKHMNSSRTEILLILKTEDVTAIRVTNSYSHTFTHMNWLLNNRLCYICVSVALYKKKKEKGKINSINNKQQSHAEPDFTN